ncbi:hypothetical protein Tco_0390811 [Tanacetum coccineum]
MTAIPETSTILVTTVPPSIKPFTPIPQQSTPTLAPTTSPNITSVPVLLDFSSLFGFDQRASTLEKELAQIKQVNHSAQILASIKYEIPAIKAQEEKDRYIDLDEKSIKDIIKDEVKSQLPQILPKEVSNFATPVIQSAINESLKNVILAKSSSQPKSTYEAAASLTDKPLPLIEAQGLQVVPANYFFNNDLKYLKGGSSSRKYTNSTTKTKATKYDNIEGIKDMVLTLWSRVKVAYDKYDMWDIAHLSPKRQKFYGYASNRKSTHDVFFKRRIIAVTHVKVMKWYDYGYLEEIVVQREDNILYTFREGDFPRLNLRDIEDMLLLLVYRNFQIWKERLFSILVSHYGCSPDVLLF